MNLKRFLSAFLLLGLSIAPLLPAMDSSYPNDIAKEVAEFFGRQAAASTQTTAPAFGNALSQSPGRTLLLGAAVLGAAELARRALNYYQGRNAPGLNAALSQGEQLVITQIEAIARRTRENNAQLQAGRSQNPIAQPRSGTKPSKTNQRFKSSSAQAGRTAPTNHTHLDLWSVEKHFYRPRACKTCASN